MTKRKHPQEENIVNNTPNLNNAADSSGEPQANPAMAAEPASLITENTEGLTAEIEALQSELEQTQTKAQEYLEGWQRARADFANYKKRVERDQAQTYQTAAGNTIKRYLEISDDLERALKNRPQDGDGAAWASGIELIYRKLLAAFEIDGVAIMQAEGNFFDPTLHEAISQEDSPEHESGQIIEVLQPGYHLGERVLRPARVRVAR
jgi:molecular chaperone GrpE